VQTQTARVRQGIGQNETSSASVSKTSMVLPDMAVTISPGRWARLPGMFRRRE